VIDKLTGVLQMNYITLLIVGVFLVSLVLGYSRGATASAKQLIRLVSFGAMTLIAIFLAWKLAGKLSPVLQTWLGEHGPVVPNEELGAVQQLYYAFVTSLHDFSLFRYACLFIPAYFVIRALLGFGFNVLTGWSAAKDNYDRDKSQRTFASGIIGMCIGAALGAARALVIVFILFVYVTLQPQSTLSSYAQGSSIYQQSASQILAPFSEDFIASQVPVFTRAVQQEFQHILQRKYELIDRHIPTDIAGAAIEITKGFTSDEEKAHALYEWVGSRIVYDHEKVRRYEEENDWMEQTPKDTFMSRKGVCIDYARLYAMMARSVDLDVRVITGLGYDGRGGYGPHAWNEVYVTDSNEWIPLDSTWASSGGNWFNPDQFEETHVADA
jgi:uncharacterized membrane protein required for colicin V production